MKEKESKKNTKKTTTTKPKVVKKEKKAFKKTKEISISKLDKKIEEKIDSMDKITNDEIKKDNNVEITFSLFEVILMIIITILSCLLVFSFIMPDKSEKIPSENNNDVADKEYTKDDIELFLEQYNYILNNYYGEIDKDKLLKSAVEGMLNSLDVYSQIIDEESNSFVITLEGEYEGVGISIYNDEFGNIVIADVYDNTPAAKAGLKTNDIIKKFNDTDLTNVATSDLVNMIASKDEMQLTILRGEEEITVTIKREKVILKSVNYEMLENKIGYIDVDIFANNTPGQFKEALAALEKQKMKSLIIDLRDNTGGHLSAVEEMLYSFLNDKYVIYQMEDQNGTTKYYSKGNKTKKYDIVILQNGSSASASEIMAAALQENLNAYIIGNRSFGKGTVQTLINMDDNTQYKVTTKIWKTPNGNWIDGKGITPNLEINQSNEYYLEPTKENDNQLQAAIKYLK